MENYLMHHGVKGQKWGRRNGPPYPLDESAAKARSKAAKYQSNDELKANVKRLKEEKSYNDLMKELYEPTRSEKARKWISEQASDAASYATKKATHAVIDQLEKELKKSLQGD